MTPDEQDAALQAALEQLPAEEPVPAALQAQTRAALQARHTAPPRRAAPAQAPWAVAAGLTAAAAAFALGAQQAPPAQLQLGDGHQVLDGEITVQVGEGTLELDGRAQITVGGAEPAAPSARGAGAEVSMSAPQPLALAGSALAGALVTFTLLEGAALWTDAEGSRPLQTGEALALAGPAPAGRAGPPSPARVPTSTPAAAPGAGRGALSPAEQIRSLELELAATRAQLAQFGGVPGAWPADLAPGLRPEQVRPWAEGLAALPGVRGVEVDCEEYPCMLTFEAKDPSDPDWSAVRAALEDQHPAVPEGTQVSVGVSEAVLENDDGSAQSTLIAWLADAATLDNTVRQRLNVRVQDLLEDAHGGAPLPPLPPSEAPEAPGAARHELTVEER
ncbi:MAG: hypothetical protein RL071_767 [Pseudomonadota bacterium]